MKKTIAFALLLMATLSATAQTIKLGDNFFDGHTLYYACDISKTGVVEFAGSSYDPVRGEADGVDLFRLKKQAGAGKYTLVNNGALTPPFNTVWGAEVEYVRQQGMNFLAVSDGRGNLAEIIVLTPDKIEDLYGQQQFALQQNIFDTISDMLINTHLLQSLGFTPLDLADCINRLKAKRKPTLIERYNLRLLQGYFNYLNSEAERAFSNPDGLGGDGRGEE